MNSQIQDWSIPGGLPKDLYKRVAKFMEANNLRRREFATLAFTDFLDRSSAATSVPDAHAHTDYCQNDKGDIVCGL